MNEITIWLFQNRLSDVEIILELFAAFDEQLSERWMVAKEGRIVEASIVPVPNRHISRKDHEKLKDGEIPEARKKISRSRDSATQMPPR